MKSQEKECRKNCKQSTVYFADIAVESMDASKTLPAKFKRMLKRFELGNRVKDKSVGIKMHSAKQAIVMVWQIRYLRTFLNQPLSVSVNQGDTIQNSTSEICLMSSVNLATDKAAHMAAEPYTIMRPNV